MIKIIMASMFAGCFTACAGYIIWYVYTKVMKKLY